MMLNCFSRMLSAKAAKSGSSLKQPVTGTFFGVVLLFVFCPAHKLEADIFARDSQTELTIDPPASADGRGIFSLAHFIDSSNGEDFDFSGSLKSDGKLYRLEEPPDHKSGASITVEGDLGGDRLEIKTSGLADTQNNSYDFSGTYRKLSAAELQRRAQRRYEESDTWLNEIYRQAKDDLASGPFADLKKREADWITYRDSFAEQTAEINANAESLSKEVVRLQSLRDLTMSRIQFIRHLLDTSLPAGISAVYRDEYGGELDLEKDDKGVKFSLSVVRGPTAHTGEISGRIVLRSGTGIFRDPNPLEGELPAEIKLSVLDDRRVEIKARHDRYLRGARAYFDGVYFKSGPLTESIEAE
jgi:uncharacterized protein YecT (DUF1311 family)